nr:hypothetical protein [Tanacetum cinerariifolium]
MSKHKLVKKFLTSLPRRFVHIIEALEQVLDLKTTVFEDVVGRLKAYKKESKKKIRQTILKKSCFMLGLKIPTRIATQVEGEDVVCTLGDVVEVLFKDIVEAKIKTMANMTPGKTMKIISKRGSNMSN